MMFRTRYTRLAARSLSIAVAAAVAALGSVMTAAQEKPAAAASEEPLETIVITGSRILTPNATSTSPIQTVTSQDITLQGATDVGNLLNTLPQVNFLSAVDLSNRQNPLATPGGESTVDLRGLGPPQQLRPLPAVQAGRGNARAGRLPQQSRHPNGLGAGVDHLGQHHRRSRQVRRDDSARQRRGSDQRRGGTSPR